MSKETEVETLSISDENTSETGNEQSPEQEDRGDEISIQTEEPSEGQQVKETADKEGDPDKPGKEPTPTVPYQRFKEVNEKYKQLEEELTSLKNQLLPQSSAKEQEKPFDFDTKEEEYATAVLEGDMAKAKAIRAEIRKAELAQAEEIAEARVSQREMQRELKTVSQRALEKYPFLNHEAEEANKEAIEEVREWRDFYHGKGYSWPEALQRAVDKVAKAYESAQPTEKQEKETPEPTNDRKITAIKRNADAEKRIPALPSGQSGGGEKRIDIFKLSEKEFESLSETEKSRLRGDIV